MLFFFFFFSEQGQFECRLALPRLERTVSLSPLPLSFSLSMGRSYIRDVAPHSANHERPSAEKHEGFQVLSVQ